MLCLYTCIIHMIMWIVFVHVHMYECYCCYDYDLPGYHMLKQKVKMFSKILAYCHRTRHVYTCNLSLCTGNVATLLAMYVYTYTLYCMLNRQCTQIAIIIVILWTFSFQRRVQHDEWNLYDMNISIIERDLLKWPSLFMFFVIRTFSLL